MRPTLEALLETACTRRLTDPKCCELKIRAFDAINDGEFREWQIGRDQAQCRYVHNKRVVDGHAVYPTKEAAIERGGKYWDYTIMLVCVVMPSGPLWLGDLENSGEKGGCQCMSASCEVGVEKWLIGGQWYAACKHVGALVLQLNETAEWVALKSAKEQFAIDEAERAARLHREAKAARRVEIAAENAAKAQRRAVKAVAV